MLLFVYILRSLVSKFLLVIFVLYCVIYNKWLVYLIVVFVLTLLFKNPLRIGPRAPFSTKDVINPEQSQQILLCRGAVPFFPSKNVHDHEQTQQMLLCRAAGVFLQANTHTTNAFVSGRKRLFLIKSETQIRNKHKTCVRVMPRAHFCSGRNL